MIALELNIFQKKLKSSQAAKTAQQMFIQYRHMIQ